MIYQTRDLDLINRIANSGEVKSGICYHDDGRDMDFAPALGQIVFLTDGEDALGVFVPDGNRRWQAHTFFGALCRGRKAIAAAREMIEKIIPRDADVIWGATPIANRAARWFNRQIGAVPVGYDEYEAEGPVELFEVRH